MFQIATNYVIYVNNVIIPLLAIPPTYM